MIGAAIRASDSLTTIDDGASMKAKHCRQQRPCRTPCSCASCSSSKSAALRSPAKHIMRTCSCKSCLTFAARKKSARHGVSGRIAHDSVHTPRNKFQQYYRLPSTSSSTTTTCNAISSLPLPGVMFVLLWIQGSGIRHVLCGIREHLRECRACR